MADIDRIEELMCKHHIDAIGTGDEDGYYDGRYSIDGNDFLELLEQAERVKELEEFNKALQETSMLNANEVVTHQELVNRYKQALEEARESLLYVKSFEPSVYAADNILKNALKEEPK